MVRRTWHVWAAGLAVVIAAGLLIVSPGPAMGQQGQQGPREQLRERCQTALPQAQFDPIMARYRDRLAAARDAVAREERALRSLLVADNTTRAALEAQLVKTDAARSALSRVRLDMLWEIRGVIPATNREAAIRCAEVFLIRGR